jgi:galactokinase
MVPEGWCARQLIDDVDQLRININRTIDNADRIIQGRTANERIQRMRQRADGYRLLVNNQQTHDRQCYIDDSPSSSFCLNEQIGNLTYLFNEFEHDFKQTQIEIHHEQDEAKQLFQRVRNEHERVREQANMLARFADHMDAFSTNLTQHTHDDPSSIVNLIDRYDDNNRIYSYVNDRSCSIF